MAKIPHLELVSFDICPYVQRSVITLLHKKVDFKITYIDLQSPPEWFPKRSPLGKVPLLFVREAEGSEPVTLFESAVINEFVDEITPPALTPREPLRRAFERAWIEVGSELLGSLFSITMAGSDEDRKEARDELWSTMDRLEDILPGGKTFREASSRWSTRLMRRCSRGCRCSSPWFRTLTGSPSCPRRADGRRALLSCARSGSRSSRSLSRSLRAISNFAGIPGLSRSCEEHTH